MKKLLLYRHAKSSWDDLYLEDHKRPLALRGLRDAPYMAQRLKKKAIFPDAIISSDAERAKATALITAESLHFPKAQIELRRGLYHASAQAILTEVKQTDGQYDLLFVFGHNPGLTDLVNFLGQDLDNLPTCGQFGFTFDTSRWADISAKNAEVWFYDYPKNKEAV
jgi:phosphohistidine phosphatase